VSTSNAGTLPTKLGPKARISDLILVNLIINTTALWGVMFDAMHVLLACQQVSQTSSQKGNFSSVHYYYNSCLHFIAVS
jgi:hypothetical protein